MTIAKRTSIWISSSIILIVTVVAALITYYVFNTSATPMMNSPKAVSVTLETVKERVIPIQFSTIGTIISPRTVMLKAQQAGLVTHIYFQSGEQVTKGQRLLQIDNHKQQAALAKAKANLFSLKTDYQRNLQMTQKDHMAVSANTLDQKLGAVRAAQAVVASARESLTETTVRAPFAGQIGALEPINNSTNVSESPFKQSSQVTLGSYLAEGDSIVILTDPNALLIQYQLPQEYSTQMAVNQQVHITIAQHTWAEKTDKSPVITGTVSYISPTLITNSHAYLAHARINTLNKTVRLKPGMTVLLTQTLQEDNKALVVPGLSLVPTFNGFSVYTVDHHKAKAVPIEIGNRYNTWVIINHGLKPGDQIITNKLNDIHPGSWVTTSQTI
ncbi:efflux RND transporter periplasmic adaptor subunit [Piscirickettsia salmonis]|uniref:efflux RND transporter periplasmic adaptor subunit n=1 Tax=Piscirickettsia salmonis TaxID=1238 RepID=UPI003A809732